VNNILSLGMGRYLLGLVRGVVLMWHSPVELELLSMMLMMMMLRLLMRMLLSR